MRFICSLFAAFGATLFVGGVCAFLFGAFVLREDLIVSGLGPFDRKWTPYDYCFLGAILASTGAGVGVLGWFNTPRETELRPH